MLEESKQRGKRIEEADRRYEETGRRLDWHMFLVLGAVFEVMYLKYRSATGVVSHTQCYLWR